MIIDAAEMAKNMQLAIARVKHNERIKTLDLINEKVCLTDDAYASIKLDLSLLYHADIDAALDANKKGA